MVHGGLFVEKNWTPRLADRLGSVRTDSLPNEHWARDIAPVMYPHLPNSFWIEAPGEPPVELPVEPPVEPAALATSAEAGTPGDFQPTDSTVPVTMQDMAAVAADPTTTWGEGQYVVLADEVTECYWDGSAWDDGRAPAPAPGVVTVTGVFPNGGTRNGGDGVTIVGSGFVGVDRVTGVMFGSTPATGVILDDPTQLTCLSPQAHKGTVDVSVTGAGGTGTLPKAYTFNGPTQFQAQSASEPSGPSATQQVAQDIQESAETIGQAAQDIGEAAQTLAEPSGTDPAPSTTSEALGGSEGTTEAPPTGPEPDLTEYEMDQYWGIGQEPGAEAGPEADNPEASSTP